MLAESLFGAYHAFYNGDVQDCHELIDSAIRTYPDTRSWKQYRRLIWMLPAYGPTAWNALRRLAFWRGIAYRRDAAAGSLA